MRLGQEEMGEGMRRNESYFYVIDVKSPSLS